MIFHLPFLTIRHFTHHWVKVFDERGTFLKPKLKKTSLSLCCHNFLMVYF